MKHKNKIQKLRNTAATSCIQVNYRVFFFLDSNEILFRGSMKSLCKPFIYQPI